MLEILDDIYELPFFSDDDRKLRLLCSSFCKGFSFPLHSEMCLDNGQEALKQALEGLAQAGLLDYTLYDKDKSHHNTTSLALIREILAYHSVIADLAFIMQVLGSFPVQIAGSSEQQAPFLKNIISGQAIGAFALTEAQAGSDVKALQSYAKPQGNGYLLNGSKRLISNVGVATHYCVFAQTSLDPQEISVFLLPAGLPGIELCQTPTMTPHPLGSLKFKDVFIEPAMLLGKEGQGAKIAFQTLAHCRPSVGAAACGFARRALEEALRYVKKRKAFGKTLADQQLVQSALSQSVSELDAARLLVYRATKTIDNAPEERHDRIIAEAKWFATETSQRIIDRCLQVTGGIGTLDSCILSQMYRAIRPLRIYEGASEIQSIVIAKEMLHSLTSP